MTSTPVRFIQALNLVTSDAAPQLELMGAVRATHFSRIRAAHEDKNIVGVGISEKIIDKQRTGELAVCFYVEKKLSPNKVTKSHTVPQVINLPGDTAVFTDVKEIGQLRLEIASKSKPLQSGFSIGHHKITAGTLGAIVKRDGKLYVLSNSHVLALSGKGKIGDKIIYPGETDGGVLPDNLVANLSHFEPFDTSGSYVNKADAALALIEPDYLKQINPAIHKAISPFKTIAPKRGMKVTKAGRTTGKTNGEVIDVNFRFILKYPGVGSVGFIEQVLCSRYTDGGDSGSTVVDIESGKIVGLHFAGANGGSVFNPIKAVIDQLKFTFVSP